MTEAWFQAGPGLAGSAQAGFLSLSGPPILHSPGNCRELPWLLTSFQDCCEEQWKELGKSHSASYSSQ